MLSVKNQPASNVLSVWKILSDEAKINHRRSQSLLDAGAITSSVKTNTKTASTMKNITMSNLKIGCYTTGFRVSSLILFDSSSGVSSSELNQALNVQ